MSMLRRPKWLVWLIFLWPIVSIAAQQSAGRRYGASGGALVRRPLTRQIVMQCAAPYFPNGEAKIRNRGRMIRFDCTNGFKLVGNRYSNCQNGRWDTSVPVCVKSGCESLPKVESGYVLYELNKASAWLSCFEGTELAGSKKTYCNGTHWDRPLGVCRQTGQLTPTMCDFETESLCGWTNDVLHDFDWKRSDGTLNPRALRTGPKYDHTTMQPKAGHFILVDSSEQFTNESARFVSPLFEPEYGAGACFQFYYHMYGETVGSLRVYVKPMSSDLYDLKPLFLQEGNQKNVWHEGHVDIPRQEERFQIILEASLGNRYKSDIAIDDVSLLQGDSCRVAVEDGLDPEEPPTDSEKVPVKIESCENRCGSNMTTILNANDTIVHCDCHDECVASDTCCPDYRERCVFGVVPNVTSISVSTSTTVRIPATTTTIRSATSTIVPPITSSTTPVPTTPSTTSTTVKATTRPLIIASVTTIPTTSTTAQKKPAFVGLVNYKRMHAVNETTWYETTVRPTNPKRTTSTSVPEPNDVVELATSVESVKVLPIAIPAFATESIPSSKGVPMYFIYAILATLLFMAILTFTVYQLRRSRSGVLARLKEKSQKKFVEDIRFLAGDEDLDFNITLGNEVIEDEAAESPDRKRGKQKSVETSKVIQQETGRTQRDADDASDEHDYEDLDSTDDENGPANGPACKPSTNSGSSKASGKKPYQKYVKTYDEDMQATLL
ncbi:uncharacterized protein LOC128275243 [Anopheles cruzii]|uniref:uncharacterized protein LOC128275243 n=1 Tax=Anopheles cruzii TaxID=68878 RepID=UPI0022EC4ACE|nr:uncharacterized protein LOC128275243 [Anopheles cruzii]